MLRVRASLPHGAVLSPAMTDQQQQQQQAQAASPAFDPDAWDAAVKGASSALELRRLLGQLESAVAPQCLAPQVSSVSHSGGPAVLNRR